MQNKLKICPRCKIKLLSTAEYFDKDKSRIDKLSCWCKECKSEYYKKPTKERLYKDREWFIENYIVLEKDFQEMAKIAKCGYRSIRRWRKKLNIPLQYQYRNFKGRKFSETHRENISKSRLGKYRGKDNPNWKDGITPLMRLIRTSLAYEEWRMKVYRRDYFKCMVCGEKKKINAHHIYPMRDFIDRVFDVENGITLCKKCHRKTFGKEYKYVNNFLYLIKQFKYHESDGINATGCFV